MAEKPKVPEGIERYFKRKNAGDAYMQVHDDEVINAHRAGVQALIKARQAHAKEGQKFTHADIELEHLKNADVENTYVAAVKKHFLTKAKEKFKINPGDKLDGPGDESGLLELYSGFTDQSLRQFYHTFVNGGKVSENGPEYNEISAKAHFTSSRFAEMYRNSDAAQKLRNRIAIDTQSHLHGTEHVKDILKYTGAEKHMKSTTLIRSGLELIALLEGHKKKGDALSDEETYVLLNKGGSQAFVDTKYHEKAMKLQGTDASSKASYSKMYLPPPPPGKK